MSKVLTLSIEYEHDYTLIGINGTIEDYKLAYFLNKYLQINLERQVKDLDFKSKNCTFTLFCYECAATFSSWTLVSNTHRFLAVAEQGYNLFDEESKITYLINEKKDVDYFIKINGDQNKQRIKKILEKIKMIKGVTASYNIDPNTLKSKDFLIF